MRRVGTIGDVQQGRRFVDYLYAIGVDAYMDEEGDVAEVWVKDEDQLAETRSKWEQFLDKPDDAVFVEAGRKAEHRRREARQENVSYWRNIHTAQQIRRAAWLQAVPVTKILIGLSVVATLFGGLGSGSALTQWLSITTYTVADGSLLFQEGLPEIVRGEVWRLITPIFLHASLMGGGIGLLHILFNMLWLWDLGGTMERAQGWRQFLIRVLVLGAASSLFQYMIAGPAFGGMSGVVFGLLGYSWVRGRLDLTSGLQVHAQTMFLMTFWFFLGLTGAIGAIANAAHGAGLAIGLLWGYVDALRVNRPQRAQ